MKQMDIEDWLKETRVILEMPPAQGIQQRAFIIEQLTPILKPVLHELEALRLSDTAICEALHYFTTRYSQRAQDQLTK